jgi:hypothetical protein
MRMELNPKYYQPTVHRFVSSQTCARPRDEVVVNWDTDALFPLSLQTEVVIQTPSSTYVDEDHPLGQRFENLPPVGSLSLIIPEHDPQAVRMTLDLSYSNNDYTGFVGQIPVELSHCDPHSFYGAS